MITTKLFIICALLGKSLSYADPCDVSIELHSISGRSPLSSARIPCDAYLTERWYLTPRYDMITYNPGLYSCGSIFPIYLQGTLPSDTEIHDITACMVSPVGGCAETFIVKVKNCGDDRAYYLSPTSMCSSTYCFSPTRDQDPAPSWTPSSLSVLPDVDFTDPNTTMYYFTCSFTPASDTLLYKITWFVNSAKIKDSGYLTGSDIVSLGSLNQTDLTNRGYQMNIMISCGVVASYSIEGLPGNYTQSPDFYAGIRVLNRTIFIQAGENATVHFKPTIPIPCPGYIRDVYCNYTIWMFENYNDYKCQETTNIASNQRCGVNMKGAKQTEETTTRFQTRHLETEIQMLVKHRIALVEDNQRVYTLRLRVSNTLFNSILSGTVLDDIKVTIVPKSTKLKNEGCFGIADPHMRTFDGNHYEMHMLGSFLMYRHTELNITVQARTKSCERYGIYCFCGVVVNAGRDVFMVDICQGYKFKYDGFTQCEDGLLKASNSGSEYEIFLPTGTIVKLRLLPNVLLDVYIYPSILDINKTEGLCGTFDENIKNDFKLRSGEYQAGHFNYPTPSNHRTYVNDFSSSWKLEYSENLFLHDGGSVNYDSLIPLSNRTWFCYCEFNTEEYNGSNPTDLHPEAKCDYRQYADCIDKRGRQIQCTYFQSTSTLHKISDYFTNQCLNQHVRKRKAALTYTRAMAYDLCFQRFQESKIIQLCTEAGVIDDSSFNLCVTDLMITSDVAWIDEQIESARLQCVHAVDFNKTLQRELTNVTDAIKSISCQNSCSGQGICVNGTCICNDGYDEIDCSVNKAEPPEIYNSSHQFIHGTNQSYSCDRSTDNCQEIELFGQGFVYDPPPEIRIRKYKITTEYTLELDNQYTKSCIWRGKFVTTCDLGTEDIPSDVFGSHYKYEISNDGINFGSEMTLDVFQSTCQEVTQGTTGITYKLKDNYCLINGICYVNNAKDPSTSCNVCKSKEEKFKWSTSTEGDCSTETYKTYTNESSDALIIGLSIVGALIAVATVAAVVIACKAMSRKPVTPHGKSANATYFTTLPTPPMPTSSKLPPLSRSAIAHLFEPTSDYMHTTAFQEFQHGADNRPVSRPTSATSIRLEAF